MSVSSEFEKTKFDELVDLYYKRFLLDDEIDKLSVKRSLISDEILICVSFGCIDNYEDAYYLAKKKYQLHIDELEGKL